jgi:hypothetical protein
MSVRLSVHRAVLTRSRHHQVCCLSVCLSACLLIEAPIRGRYWAIHPSICLPLRMKGEPHLHTLRVDVCQSVCLPVCPYVHPPVRLYERSPTCTRCASTSSATKGMRRSDSSCAMIWPTRPKPAMMTWSRSSEESELLGTSACSSRAQNSLIGPWHCWLGSCTGACGRGTSDRGSLG